MEISFHLVDNNEVIASKIITQLSLEVKKVLNSRKSMIILGIQSLLNAAIKGAPEYQSLFGGKLQAELGVDIPERRLSTILAQWLSSFVIEGPSFISTSRSVKANFTISAVKRDFSDVVELDAAIVTSDKGQRLRWLEWLLKLGDKTIIRDYEVTTRFHKASSSRTGLAVMIKSKKRWSVPSEFSGTINDNWITRAIDKLDPLVENFIVKEIETAWGD